MGVKDSTMTDQTQIASLEQSTFLWKQKFILTHDEIRREWRSLGGGNSGQETIRLDDASPNLSHQSTFGHDAKPSIAKGVILLLSAFCIYFSSFNKDIPLLAPLLLLASIPFLIAGVSRMKQYEWTIIVNSKGQRIFFIPNNGTSPDERERFEESLGRIIRDMLQKKEDSQPPASPRTRSPKWPREP